MAKKRKSAISPTRTENYPEWYQQVIRAADLAEVSPVRGCMVIKPWGYAIWENMQRVLDRAFKETGHQNAYFPLFIPKSFLEKEAEHVEGFAKECAVVTHHRLEEGPDGGLIPAGPLEEPLVVRPTSETIIGAMFAKWVQSYRDLPLLINQWANVVRWELRTRMFLRTTEFLWQEGHTAHATSEEAVAETMQMLDVYAKFAEETMAMPVIQGEKTAAERFPGAVATWTIEAMMQDRKALQAGTSHFLGQNFSRAQEIMYESRNNQREFAWTTSWGVSTRLVGALIMTHSDDDGLIVPPKLAPAQVVIIPMLGKDTDAAVLEYCDSLRDQLREIRYDDERLRVNIDKRDVKGVKKWEHYKKGVPVILEIGGRDLANDSVFMLRRDTGAKSGSPRAEFVGGIANLLSEIQANLYERAMAYRDSNSRQVASVGELQEMFANKAPGGFASAFAADDASYEAVLAKMKVSARCIPRHDNDETGTCIFTGATGVRRIIFSRAY